MEKIAFLPHKTRGQEVIKILEKMGGVNVYNLDGSETVGFPAVISIERNQAITNDFDARVLYKMGYKIYTLEEYEKQN